MGGNDKLRLVYKIEVQNLRKYQVKIEILYQLPVNQIFKIEIKDIDLNPALSEKNEQGILSWSFTLSPQEKREILIDFTIEHPKGAIIRGI